MNSGVSRKRPDRIALTARKLPTFGPPNASVASSGVGGEGAPFRQETAVRLLPQPRFRDGIYDQAGFIAEFGRGRASDQFHGLDGVQRHLRGEALALLIADRLAVNREAGLRMIAQGMEEAVGIGGDGPAAQHDGIAQPGTGRRNGQFVESFGVHIVVGVGDIFQEVGAGRFHGYRRLRSREGSWILRLMGTAPRIVTSCSYGAKLGALTSMW